jgi:hypothetical protein
VKQLFFVVFFKQLSKIAICSQFNLMLLLLRERASSHLQIEDLFKVLSSGYKHLIVKRLSALDVLCGIFVFAVEQNVAPLNTQSVAPCLA